MTNKKIFWGIALFLTVLTVGRFIWLEHFTLPDAPAAQNGILDLRDWGPITESTLPLNGEWDFYPETFLYGDGYNPESTIAAAPKQQSADMSESNNYDFGTYRLRIQLEPGAYTSVGLRLPTIRSAAEVYINGDRITDNGSIGKSAATYEPVNRPQTLYYTVDESGILDLVIQYADFDYASKKGISQPITFGLIGPFTRSQNFTAIMVIVPCIIYLIHGIYSLIIYFLFGKDSRILAFFGVIIAVILGTLISERLLFEWVPFNFEWRTKVIFLTMLMGGFSISHAIKSRLPVLWRDTFARYYTLACGIAFALIVLLPARVSLAGMPFYIALMLTPCLLLPLTLAYVTIKIDSDTIFLLFAGIASMWSLLWLIVNHTLSIEMVPYPFDLLIALFCFSSYWFKRYFKMLHQSRDLALKLQEEDKQKDAFLTTVAHEMRNPLHAILNITNSVIEKEADRMSEPARNDLELLQEVGRHMSTLLNTMLDLERLALNRMELQLKEVSLHNTAGAVLDMISYMTDGKTVQLVNRVPEDFPLVNADQNRLIQILFNLLHNAVKYAEVRELAVSAVVVNGTAQISVSDNGIGIDAAHLDTLFDRYTQVYMHSDTADNSGIGLGLNICQRLVNLHGGELSVSSVVGEGTVFTFTLPLAEAISTASAADVINAINEKSAFVKEQTAPEGMRINAFSNKAALGENDVPDSIRLLAVDDDPVNLKILQSLFPAPEYAFSKASNGVEALALLERGSWDIVVADVMLPHMSGYELTRQIRERFTSFELPVLLLTARGQAEDIVAGFRVGANDYVTKPIEGYVLKARINTLVHLKSSINDRIRFEAAFLQAQIQPHFLFNTINSIVSLAESDIGKMTELLIAFGDYLRYSFSCENAQPLVPIRHELELLEAYLFIQKQRFGDRINVLWDVDESLSFEIPPLSIQPLVENAIKHGILKRVKGGTVQIRIAEETHAIIVTIRDDGVGMTADQVTALRKERCGNGIGIRNTNRRLKQLFGQELTIFSIVDDGTTVCFEVPKE